jgi:hypothetical protein
MMYRGLVTIAGNLITLDRVVGHADRVRAVADAADRRRTKPEGRS